MKREIGHPSEGVGLKVWEENLLEIFWRGSNNQSHVHELESACNSDVALKEQGAPLGGGTEFESCGSSCAPGFLSCSRPPL